MGTREAWAIGIAVFGLFVISLGAYIGLVRAAVARAKVEMRDELSAVETAWRNSFEQVLAENVAVRTALAVHGKAIRANGGQLHEITGAPEATGRWSLDNEKDDE